MPTRSQLRTVHDHDAMWSTIQPRLPTMPDLLPLTADDLKAHGFLAISYERDDRMGAVLARDCRPYVYGFDDTRCGAICYVQRHGAFWSVDPEYGNHREILRNVAVHDVLNAGGDVHESNRMRVWYATELAPDVLAKCFNATMVPVLVTVPESEWRKSAIAAGVLPDESANYVRVVETQAEWEEKVSRMSMQVHPLTPDNAPAAPRVIEKGMRVLICDGTGEWLDEFLVDSLTAGGNLVLHRANALPPKGRVYYARPVAVVEVLP